MLLFFILLWSFRAYPQSYCHSVMYLCLTIIIIIVPSIFNILNVSIVISQLFLAVNFIVWYVPTYLVPYLLRNISVLFCYRKCNSIPSYAVHYEWWTYTKICHLPLQSTMLLSVRNMNEWMIFIHIEYAYSQRR